MSLSNLLFQSPGLSPLVTKQRTSLFALLELSRHMHDVELAGLKSPTQPAPPEWLLAAMQGFVRQSDVRTFAYTDPGTSVQTMCGLLLIDPHNRQYLPPDVVDQERPTDRKVKVLGVYPTVDRQILSSQNLVLPTFRQALCYLAMWRLVHGTHEHLSGIWCDVAGSEVPIHLKETNGSFSISNRSLRDGHQLVGLLKT